MMREGSSAAHALSACIFRRASQRSMRVPLLRPRIALDWKQRQRLRLGATLLALSTIGALQCSQAADHRCKETMTPMAAGELTSALSFTASALQTRAQPDTEEQWRLIFDAWRKDPTNQMQLQQQVDEKRVREAALIKFGIIPYSKAELARQANSHTCNEAFRVLQEVFYSSAEAMEWDWAEGELERFVVWRQDRRRTPSQLAAAKPVEQAQRKYSKACLQSDVPQEMGSDLVKQAVGLLYFENEPICSALRMREDKIRTALHCFMDFLSGKESDPLKAAKQGKGRYWFAFEAQPADRFQICSRSLPKAVDGALHPAIDSVTLEIAPTSAPVSPISWVTSPSAGTSLYLRGYFAYADADAALSRMRSSEFGGCVALNVSARCLLHACQTTPIMSVTCPVFQSC